MPNEVYITAEVHTELVIGFLVRHILSPINAYTAYICLKGQFLWYVKIFSWNY